jgi:hypothetical protein
MNKHRSDYDDEMRHLLQNFRRRIVMDLVIEKLKEAISLKNANCNSAECHKCQLNTVIKEIWYDSDYEEIDICDFLQLIEQKL